MPVVPRLEIVFKRGKPVAAFLHLREGSGRTGRQQPVLLGGLKLPLVAHFDGASGRPSGLEIALPIGALTLAQLNDALRDLGAEPLTEADFAALQ